MAECAAEIAAAWRAGELSEAHIARCEASRGRVQFEYIRKNVPSAVEESLEGLRRVASIVAAMRDFSHPSGGKKAPADLGDVLRTAATVARNEWKRVAELTIDVDDDVPKVACLRDELGQVFLNLIVNAAHAIAAAQRNTQGSIRISARRDRDFVEVRVRDTGTGIPAEVRSRVFDPFFTTKAVGQGTGQGLAICYATVVEKHAGQIDFESELGVGTTFIVRLPIVDVTVAVV
jgi:signal transduction histidine kinase